jgi:hypothetical protein
LWSEALWEGAGDNFKPAEETGGKRAGLCVMAGKSFLMLVLASMLGPAVGVGLFVLLNAF